jgi:uncharacterized membrane protein YfcA
MSAGLTVVTALVVAFAAFVQGSTGLGFALVVAPVVGIFEPALLPVLLLVLMIPLNVYVAWRERESVDRRGASWITLGRLAGTLGGLWVLTAVPVSKLSLLIGISTVVAALAALVAPTFRPGRLAFVAAGAFTGITETSTGIGGPPLALVYQHRPAPVLRSTVALCFVLGEAVSLAVLAVNGRVHASQLHAALLLAPALGLGALTSRWVHRRVDGPAMRFVVLTFALVSGAVLLLRG